MKIYRKMTLLLIIITLLFGFTKPTYATNKNESESKTVTSVSKDARNGNLTKNSKYPFYDECNVLSRETKNMILKINKNFEKDGTQIGVVVLKSLNETSIEEKANNVFNTWHLGSKEKNNGALLLISISDRKFRLEVGDGLRNTVIPDYEAKNIINKMIPYFKKDAYNLGINVALFEIDQKFYQYNGKINDKTSESSNNEIQKITNHLEEKTSNTAQTTVLICAMVILIVLVVIVAKIIYEDVAYKKEQKELGEIHHFKIKITDQYGNTTAEQHKDYSNRDVSEDGIACEIKDLVLYQERFGEDVVSFTIEKMNPNLENLKYKDLDTIDVTIKTEGEEDQFANDHEKVKATKDFYNKLSPEEKNFYKMRATSSMNEQNGNDIWFYLYLYMLSQSDRSDDFRTSMSKSNIKGDNYYTPPTNTSHKSSSYSDDSNSHNDSNDLDFGGFGGGFSSGGGASGGW
ncbi:MAG: TPM domain-containing protein [Finegoldia magna]|uniref:TPM domain-containing protein n=1 Tax=Finegoldia magna TaxID=1260 RepID=UPI002909F0AB|nr:TPM domain-containing protein [Finegoldia magna]MDU5527590.1 TPM domain-containing protein [Finegoldia magna]